MKHAKHIIMSTVCIMVLLGIRCSERLTPLEPIDGDTTLSEHASNTRLSKPSGSHVFLFQWGSHGSGSGQFNYPYGIAVDGTGNVFVQEYFNHRIQKFNSTGAFISQWGSYGSGIGQFVYYWEKDLAKKKNTDAKAFALKAAKIASERHCSDIVVLDLKGKSPATDYFVIATGTSNRQMRTVADEISELARQKGWSRFGRAGYEQGRWILLDYIDVVIHIFDNEYRDYYDLELLWGDAEKIKY